MTQHAALTEALAEAVRQVPGVAFLKPGVAQRLRAAVSDTGDSGADSKASPAGLRISRSDGNGPWKIEIQIVTLAEARALDVTRAARRAVDTCLEAMVPSAAARITITVTGIV
ncbi:hypothetical protein [Streptomyces luteolus]|uniref:Asp23/Gls24 family envelope stress response protein n=1 Tax=Streptomyces luteolus TaxID=3043615 RepID=A0ABT6STU8_9ACTN|nr:hypothetical protein [Streptomyces sp. B-S-A12]MDI3419046.1 hypothetical protein [Streptomyces sp. B-S-A12]